MVKISKKLDILGIIKIVFVLFILFIIYQVIRMALGGSWGFEELIIALIIANLGYSFFINTQMQKHLGKHSIFDRQFSALCRDFKEVKEKVHIK